MTDDKTFCMFEHQGKGDYYKRALLDRGYRLIDINEGGSFALADYEHSEQWPFMRVMTRRKLPMVLYPHAGRTCWMWDGVEAPYENTLVNFVFGTGQKQIMETYKYPYPIEPVGFGFCPAQPFKPTAGQRVLFAPVHPNNRRGNMPKIHTETNKKVFELLLSMLPKIELKVRFGRDLEECNLWVDHRVQYELAVYSTRSTLESQQWADIVVGFDTFAYIAVARGIPTVMFLEKEQGVSGSARPQHWDEYKDLLAYPLDILDAPSPLELMQEACRSDESIKQWRTDIIGGDFQPAKFVDTIEQKLKERECQPVLSQS